uniref:cysteine dioxygenase n=1 Tax=Oryza sativa subsp. japonica TaxID=39947 RepID=Q6K3F9_ORYSJ|nr:HGWP repeat containing protein-like [Oryza sativa Japonica Group]BAD22381.1 HGWP repeat containing protein-like [Oryza sativa Japonica Group]
MGVHVFADRLAFAAADWCFCLHGWPIMPPLLGVYDFTTGLPPSPPTGVLAYTVGWSHHRSWASTSSPTGWPSPPPTGVSAYTVGLLCHRCWASTTSPPACLRRRRLVPPPTRVAYYAAAVGRLRLHRRPAFAAADWCFRLHGWPIMPPLLGVYDFTAGLSPSPPSGASAYTAGLLCRRCWASTTSPPAYLRRRRVVPPPTRLAYYAAAVGRLRLHRRPASVAAEWCLRLHGWPIMPPLLGVYDFTAGLPPSPPSGASAYTAGLLCRRCWMSTSSLLAHLRCRRLVFPLTRLTYYAAISGHLRFHRRPPSSPPTGVFIVIDGRLCSHIGHFCHHQGEYYKAKNGSVRTSPPARLDRRRLVFPPARLAFMPPLLGVYVFTDRLAFAAADWCFRLHGWPLCRRCWASTSSPTGRLVRRRLVLPPARLAYYAAVVGRLRLHRPAASSAADWCFRLHGWPIMPPLLGVYVFTDRLAFAAADWCFRLHGWPIMPPLLGVYVFTDRPPRPPPTGASACTAGLLCRRCWASTSSPTGLPSPPPTGVSACTAGLYATVVGRLRLHRLACLRRCRLVFPPARLAFMPPLLGVYVFTDRLAFAAADWCFRLHGWPLCRRCWASTSSPTGLPSPPPTGVSACTAGLLCRRCWASTSSPTGRLVRRRLVLPPARLAYYAAVVGRIRLHRPACLRRCRLVFPPARLAFMPPLLGVYVFTDRLAFAAADWCFRLHGWPLCHRCWASTSSPTGLPSPPPTGVSACTAGLYAAVVGRLRLHRPACLRRRRLVFPPARLAFMPPLLGVYVFTDRLAFAAADWCFRLHGWPIMLPLLGVYVFTGRPPHPPLTDVTASTAGLL